MLAGKGMAQLKDLNIKNLCQLFEEQVEKNPGKVALLFEDAQLTYKELHQYSNALAHYLRGVGVKPEVIVGLSTESDFHLVIGILGILKAGGVYLPIDPNYPEERLRLILDDADPPVLLTQSHLAHQFTNFKNKMIFLDELWAGRELDHEKCLIEQSLANGEHLAYIIYTSGSTGKPKGVMVEHRSLANIIMAWVDLYHNDIKAVLLGSISFDMSIITIFHALISGGTLCLPKYKSNIDLDNIVDLIVRKEINFLLCVPSFYAILLQKAQAFPSLRYVLLAGENIPAYVPELHSRCVPQAFLYNEYGPTECTISTTEAKIYDPADHQVHQVTIGKPLPNIQVYLLDQDFQHLPVDAKGEIFIGGAGLARGYLNNEILTNEKFVKVSLPGQEGAVRLYRTGDFGRLLSNGDIEFLGRIDSQVKIRGYRIELGEIEHAISQFPGIKDVVVIVREDDLGNKRLVAYFSASAQIEIDALRNHLSDVLPKHMKPANYVQLENFPLTANGKIDRKALHVFPESKTMIVDGSQPQRDIEEVLLDIWKKILQCEVNLQDNFFDIGGDSLQVVNMQTMIKEILQHSVPIMDLFQYPTISLLAQQLRTQLKKETIFSAPLSNHQDISEKRKAAFQRFKKRHLDQELICDG